MGKLWVKKEDIIQWKLNHLIITGGFSHKESDTV